MIGQQRIILGASLIMNVVLLAAVGFLWLRERPPDETAVAHCVYTEATYSNSNAQAQSIGRHILNDQNAIVLLPRSPLEVGQRYTVTVVTGGQTINWQFDVVKRPTGW